MMRDHFYNLCHYRSERAAIVEFRKRVSWYAKEMNPCRLLRDEMRSINVPADFDNVIRRFLEWRMAYDAGKVPAEQDAQIAELAAV
jgi:tRNA-dihydrouridine synthase